jgi:hypothetical protein
MIPKNIPVLFPFPFLVSCSHPTPCYYCKTPQYVLVLPNPLATPSMLFIYRMHCLSYALYKSLLISLCTAGVGGGGVRGRAVRSKYTSYCPLPLNGGKWAQMALTSLAAISGPRKVSIFQGPSLPVALVIDLPASKSLRSVPYIHVFYSTSSPHSPTQPTLYPPNIKCALSSFEADVLVGEGGFFIVPLCPRQSTLHNKERRHGSTRVKKQSARRNWMGDDCCSTTST